MSATRTYSLTEARTEVRNRGDYHRSAKITDAMLNEFINKGVAALHDLLIDTWADYVTAEASLATASDVSAVALPTDFYKLLALDVLDGGDYRRLHPFTLAEQTTVERASATRENYRYRLQGRQLLIKPTPAAVDTLRLFYAPVARRLASHTVSSVDAGANTLTVTNHKYRTGDGPFRVSSTATVPGGATAGDDYWLIITDANNVKLATSQHNALVGTAVDVTSSGSGTITLEGAFEDVNGFGDFVFAVALKLCAYREERPLGEVMDEIDRYKQEIQQAAAPRDAAEPYTLPDHTAHEDGWY